MSSFSPTAAAALEVLALIEESVLDCAPAVAAIPRARDKAKIAENNIREKVFMILSPSYSYSALRVDSPLFDGISHAIDGQHVRRNTIVYVVQLRIMDNILKGVDHNVFQLLIDHRLFPEIALPVLDPLEV